jgi:hypothetical protein
MRTEHQILKIRKGESNENQERCQLAPADPG